MALTDITRGERVQHTEHRLSWRWKDSPGSGYSFPCDEKGNLLPGDAPSVEEASWYSSYVYCIEHPDEFDYQGLVVDSWSHWEPGSGKCPCGRTVWLENDYGHGIDCDCGRVYNQSGQELRPRSQWEDRYDDDSTQPYNVEFGYVREDY